MSAVSLTILDAYEEARHTDVVRDGGWALAQYSAWASKYKWLWPFSLYEEAAFQQVYTEKLFKRRGSELEALLKRHSEQRHTLYDFLEQRGLETADQISIKLLSIGCGPGIDAVALMAHLRRLEPFDGAHISFDATLADLAEGWEGKAVAAVRSAAAEGDRVTFIAGGFKRARVRRAAAAADVVIVSHLLVDMEQTGKDGPATNFFEETIKLWSAAAPGSPPKLIIYADRWQPDCWKDESELWAMTGVQHQFADLTKASERKRTCMGVVQVTPAAAADDLAEEFAHLAM